MTAPVERSGGNEWGLYGVGGNVFEWTTDSNGVLRAMRGASWRDYIDMHLRVEAVFLESPSLRDSNVGFRVALATDDSRKPDL